MKQMFRDKYYIQYKRMYVCTYVGKVHINVLMPRALYLFCCMGNTNKIQKFFFYLNHFAVPTILRPKAKKVLFSFCIIILSIQA